MKTSAVLVLITLVLFGCTDDDQIVTGSNNDEMLKAQIVGSWNGGNWYRTTYRADNTYSDSIFYRSSTDTNQYFLDFVTQGRFSITNGVLQRSNVHWFFSDTTRYQGGLSAILLSQEIEFAGNHLLLKPVDVLSSSNGFGLQLWGTWTVTTWSYHRSGGTPTVLYEGRQKYTYQFNKDSTRFRYGWEYLDGNPFPNPTFTSDFTYNPPLLDMLAPGWYNVSVQFKYGQMFWYYDFGPSELTRGNMAPFPPNKALNLTEGAKRIPMPSHGTNESIIATRGVYLESGAVLRRLAPIR